MNPIARFPISMAALLLTTTPVLAQAERVTVSANKPGPVISRHIFGQFAEQLGYGIEEGVWVGQDSPIPNVRGIRSDVVKALRELRVPNVRWPGGCFADQYHWRNGIGPRESRKVTYNINWGDPVERNAFGTHEYLDFIDQIGSEANITANVGTGTVQEAADWLEYLTTDKPTTLARERAANGHPAPYRIKFFAFGNESYGCGGPMSAESYVDKLQVFSNFARNLNPAQSGSSRFVPGPDPMVRIAVGPADNKTDYTEVTMALWQASSPRNRPFEALSFHHYTAGPKGAMFDAATGFAEHDYAVTLKNTYVMDDLIRTQSAIMDRHDPGKQVALAIDEWGVWLKPIDGTPALFLKQQNSMRDALVAAIHLNIFARHADRVRMANIAQMVNVLQSMVLTDGPRMVLTPTYHVFRMYTPFQDARLLPVSLEAGVYKHGETTLPRRDVIAAKAADGTVWLALTNLDPNKPDTIDVAVDGIAARNARGEVLSAPKFDAINTFGHPDAVKPRAADASVTGGRVRLVLPPASVAVIRLEE